MNPNMEIPTPKKNPFSAQMDLSKFEKASEEEKKQQDVMAQSSTFFRDGMKKLLRNPLAVLSLLILVFVIVLMIITPRMVPYSYSQIITVGGQRDKAAANLKPFEYSEKEQAYMQETGEKLFPHILGTDELCRDYFIRVVYGTRVSFLVGFFASLMVLAIGTLYGSISGYAGGRTDLIMMRIVDIIYSLPDLLIIILLSVVFRETGNFSKIPLIGGLGTNMVSMFIVFALLYWVGIFTESYLSFLGLGVALPMPSLGSLANTARSGMQSYPWKLVFPSVMIILIVLAFNLLADALRDAFDPKLRK